MAGDELLSAFKVASFTLDEDEEVSKLDSIHDENTKDWVSEYLKSNLKYIGACVRLRFLSLIFLSLDYNESQKHMRYLRILWYSVRVVNVYASCRMKSSQRTSVTK